MLCQFSFANFRSFRDDTTIDFHSADLKDEFEDSLIGGNLLPVTVIYGPNGGGKSNVLKAFMCLVSTILKPLYESGKNLKAPVVPLPVIECAPFRFDATAHKEPTEFLVTFRTKDSEYRYYLALSGGTVVSEFLESKKSADHEPVRCFTRENNRILPGTAIPAEDTAAAPEPGMPALSFLAIHDSIPVISEVQGWFESCLLRNCGDPVSETLVMLAERKDCHRDFVHILQDCGIDIQDFRFDARRNSIIVTHDIHGNLSELPMEEESAGVQKLLCVMPLIFIALKEGRLLVLDELDTSLHPKLLRYILSMFTNPQINKKGAQLLFTSQNLSTLKSTVFRRDEILFADINDEKKSEVFCLYELRDESGSHVKITDAYDMQYLAGHYGADPHLRNLLSGGSRS